LGNITEEIFRRFSSCLKKIIPNDIGEEEGRKEEERERGGGEDWYWVNHSKKMAKKLL
jgi:hypothetical protein